MKSLTIGSLFSGIGGLELGLERAGLGPVVWQVEKDAYCRAVLAKHWPDATRYEDVNDVGGRNLVPVNVICGGFPCQDLSTAGDGAGLGGERSGLYRELMRVVRELRPRYVVVENVATLLGRGIGDILGNLAALGYDAEWSCIQACDVGAPHQRDRVFIVAYRADDLRRAHRQGVAGSEGACAAEISSRRVRQGLRSARHDGSQTRAPSIPHSDRSRELQPQGCEQDERRRLSDGSWWSVEPAVARVVYGVPDAVDRVAALGNAVVPQVAEVVGQVILALESRAVA